MRVDRLLTNVMTDDVPGTRDFLVALLGLESIYDSDWFVVLVPAEGPRFELGIIARGSDVVPAAHRAAPQGVYLTFVVADVEVAAERAREIGAKVIEPPTDTFYGQRRMLVEDPNGLLIDLSSPTPSRTTA